MSTSDKHLHLFSDLFEGLVRAHGGPTEGHDAFADGFSFQPGGRTYRLLPSGHQEALLEIAVGPLEDFCDLDHAEQSDRVLRTLLQLNGTLLDEHHWLVSLDANDALVLSTQVPAQQSSVEAVQALALQGLQRAHALRQLCAHLALLNAPTAVTARGTPRDSFQPFAQVV